MHASALDTSDILAVKPSHTSLAEGAAGPKTTGAISTSQ